MVKSIQGHHSGLLIYTLQKDILVTKSHFPEDGEWETSLTDLLSSTYPCHRAQEGTILDRTLVAPTPVSRTLFRVVICLPLATREIARGTAPIRIWLGKQGWQWYADVTRLGSLSIYYCAHSKSWPQGSHRPGSKSQLQKEIYGVRSQNRLRCLPLWRRKGKEWG